MLGILNSVTLGNQSLVGQGSREASGLGHWNQGRLPRWQAPYPELPGHYLRPSRRRPQTTLHLHVKFDQFHESLLRLRYSCLDHRRRQVPRIRGP